MATGRQKRPTSAVQRRARAYSVISRMAPTRDACDVGADPEQRHDMATTSIPTGYHDSYGNAWVYPPSGRRYVLEQGARYHATDGTLRTVIGTSPIRHSEG